MESKNGDIKRFELSNGIKVGVTKYVANGNALAIVVFNDNWGIEVKATTYVDGFDYDKGVVIIKNYGENEGVVPIIEEMFDRKLGTYELDYNIVPVYMLKDKYIID